MSISFTQVIPILRIFDIAKADEFYLGFLGFSRRLRPSLRAGACRSIARSRAAACCCISSEHHGDCSPGAQIRVMMQGVEAFHREISAKGYRYMRPGLRKDAVGHAGDRS